MGVFVMTARRVTNYFEPVGFSAFKAGHRFNFSVDPACSAVVDSAIVHELFIRESLMNFHNVRIDRQELHLQRTNREGRVYSELLPTEQA